jgi:hypothetical protein
MEIKLFPPIIGVANTPEKSSKKGRHREHPQLPRGECSLQTASQ